MKATRTDQRTLLELQETDLLVSRLRHLLDSNPLRAKLDELEGRAEDLRRSAIAQRADLVDRQRRITAVEDEVQKVRARAEVQQGRLDSGKIGIRDMSAVEHEIKKIRERKEELEMQALELQEELEERQRFLIQTEQAQKALSDDEAATRDEIAVAAQGPADELAEAELLAAQLRDQLPVDLVDEYDELRSRLGPLAILRFEDGALINAPIELSMEEMASLRRADSETLWESDDWGYAVVRV